MATNPTSRASVGRKGNGATVKAAPAKVAGKGNGSPAAAAGDGRAREAVALHELLRALKAARDGDFSVRLSERRTGLHGEIASAYNDLIEMNARMAKELARVGRIVGREGRMTERFSMGKATGAWAANATSINSLIDDLVRPTTEVARVITAVAEGDLSQKMALRIEGQPVKGEFLRIGTAVNSMVDQLSSFADEVSRVAREVGTEGKLGGQARVKGVSGTWKLLAAHPNFMRRNIDGDRRIVAEVDADLAQREPFKNNTDPVKGEILQLNTAINAMVNQLSSFADEVTRVAREVGTE